MYHTHSHARTHARTHHARTHALPPANTHARNLINQDKIDIYQTLQLEQCIMEVAAELPYLSSGHDCVSRQDLFGSFIMTSSTDQQIWSETEDILSAFSHTPKRKRNLLEIQAVNSWTCARKVAGSNPGQTTNQVLSIIGETMLTVSGLGKLNSARSTSCTQINKIAC